MFTGLKVTVVIQSEKSVCELNIKPLNKQAEQEGGDTDRTRIILCEIEMLTSYTSHRHVKQGLKLQPRPRQKKDEHTPSSGRSLQLLHAG